MRKRQVFLLALAIALLSIVLSECIEAEPLTLPSDPFIPNITGSWNMITTLSGQTTSCEILLLQSQDNESNVVMIIPYQYQGSWGEGGYGFTGQINGNEMVLTLIVARYSWIFHGTISNGVITGTTILNGQNGMFEMNNMQPLTLSRQNSDLTGNWQFTLNDQTSGYTYDLTTEIYQDGSDLVNVITSSRSTNPNFSSLSPFAFFGTLQGNSVIFTVWEPYQIQLIGTLLTSNSMSGNLTIGSDTGTWSANFLSTSQSKKSEFVEVKKMGFFRRTMEKAIRKRRLDGTFARDKN